VSTPGGRRGIGGRIPVWDRSSPQTPAWPSTAAWHVCRTLAVREAVVPEQRTVNPLIARNNFLYSRHGRPPPAAVLGRQHRPTSGDQPHQVLGQHKVEEGTGGCPLPRVSRSRGSVLAGQRDPAAQPVGVGC
jgi:hypothetical protein